jgi:hypothetical protein
MAACSRTPCSKRRHLEHHPRRDDQGARRPRLVQLGVADALAGHVPELFQLGVELGDAEADAGHFLAGDDVVHDGLVDLDAALFEDGLCRTQEDEQLHHVGGAEAVDEEDDLVARIERQVIGEEEIEDLRREFIGGAHRDEAHAFFAMDAHAEADHVVGEFKGGLAGGGDGAGLGGDADGAGVITGFWAMRASSSSESTVMGGSTGELGDRHEAGHAAALVFFRGRRGADVVGDDDGFDGDAFLCGEFGRRCRSSSRHRRSCRRGRARLCHDSRPGWLPGRCWRWRCGEDFTHGSTIGHAFADEAVVDRLVPGTTADEEGRGIRAEIIHHDGAGAHAAGLAVIGEHEAVKEFVGALERVVDDLFGRISAPPKTPPLTPPRRTPLLYPTGTPARPPCCPQTPMVSAACPPWMAQAPRRWSWQIGTTKMAKSKTTRRPRRPPWLRPAPLEAADSPPRRLNHPQPARHSLPSSSPRQNPSNPAPP